MKTSKRFDNAIAALVKGFFNGTLAKGNCTACAVGNICAYPHKLKINLNESFIIPGSNYYNRDWSYLILARPFYYIGPDQQNEIINEVIKPTGYTVEELSRIEKVFERNTEIKHDDYKYHSKDKQMADQYNGLMAVVEVLCELEGIEDVKEYKELFNYQTV